MIETDTRGIHPLTDETDANVALLPARIWGEMIAELGDVPPVPEIDPFDDAPWLALPTMEQLEDLWLVSPAVDIMIHKLAVKLHGEGPDLPRFIATQRDLAEIELAWIRGATHATEQAADLGGPGEPSTVASAAGLGGGEGLPGGPENGGSVGKDRKTRGRANSRRASAVQGS